MRCLPDGRHPGAQDQVHVCLRTIPPWPAPKFARPWNGSRSPTSGNDRRRAWENCKTLRIRLLLKAKNAWIRYNGSERY